MTVDPQSGFRRHSLSSGTFRVRCHGSTSKAVPSCCRRADCCCDRDFCGGRSVRAIGYPQIPVRSSRKCGGTWLARGRGSSFLGHVVLGRGRREVAPAYRGPGSCCSGASCSFGTAPVRFLLSMVLESRRHPSGAPSGVSCMSLLGLIIHQRLHQHSPSFFSATMK